MRVLLQFSVVLGVAVALSAPPVSQAAVFGAPVQFDEGGRAWDLRLAAGASGDVAAVWQSPAGPQLARHSAGRWGADSLGPARRGGRPLVEVTPDGGTLVAQEIVNGQGTHDILVWRGPRSGALSGPEVISSGSTLRGGWIRPALAGTDGGRILMTWTRRTERHAGDVMLVSFDSVEGRSTSPRRLGRSSADGSAIVPAGSGAIVTWLSGRHIVGRRPVQALLARRLDGRARPTGARSTVSRNTRPEPVAAGLPGGAAATAWTAYDSRARSRRLWACRLVGTPVRCTNLTRLADDAQSQETRVEVGPGARVAVTWIGAVTADTGATPKLTLLTRAGRWTPVRDVPVAPSSRVWPPALLPAPDGTFLVAEGRRLFRLAPTGVTGPVEELAGLPARTEDAMAAATGGGAMALATTTAAPSPGISGFSTVWLGRG